MKKTALFLLIILVGCGDSFPVIEDFSNSSYELINQDSAKVDFPAYSKGKLLVAGFIFTNCPDICPLTTNNLRLIQEKVNEEGIEGVEFAGISFDPDVDTPEVLKKYAEIRNLDLSNWQFLTGEKEEIRKLMKHAGVVYAPSDSTTTENGETIYFYVHTDRISLFDESGKIRANYLGSATDINKVIEDIKSLK